MKAAVLARGRGTRMQAPQAGVHLRPDQARMADAGLKAMIPFRRPFLDYVLSALADAGCQQVCLIVGPEDDVIRPYFEQEHPRRVELSFAVQQEARGTADAVLAVEQFAGDDRFLVLNADNYYPVQAYKALATLDGPGLPVFCRSTLVHQGNVDPERVRAFAIVDVGPDGLVQDLVEKPDTVEGDPYVSMNCWRFDARIFKACRAIPPSPRGEFELPLAVRHAIHVERVPFRAVPIAQGVLDLSRRSDIPEVERRLAAIEPAP